MNLELSGRNIDITPALREFVNDQISKTSKFLKNIDEIHIILTTQKNRQIVELTIHAGNETFNSTEETYDMYAAINLSFDKIIKQARRKKKKIIGLHRKGKKYEQEITLPPAGEEEPITKPQIIKYKGFSLKPMDVEEASMRLMLSDDIFLVFRNAKTDKINVLYKRKDNNHGLIDL